MAKKKTGKGEGISKAVLDNLADGLIIANENGEITTANRTAGKYFGIKKDFLNKRIDKIKKLEPLVQFIKQCKRKKSCEEEIVFKPKRGKEIFLSITCRKIRRGQGYVIVARDITREKIVDRLKNEFISIAAHQLRTPLSGLNWVLETALSGSLGKLNSELKSFLKKAGKSNERMIFLINDLLDVSRIEEGRFIYKTKPYSLEELLKSLVAETAPYASEQGIEIQLKIPDKRIPKIRIDPDKIGLAMRNIIDNAVKYSGEGKKVEIFIRKVKKQKKRYVQVAVKDQGIGIRSSDKGRLFEKFFRADNALRMRAEGTGLGLFIVKNIIEDSGGRISFRSKEGRGTTFYAELPAGK